MSANSYRDAASRNFEALRKLYSTNDDLDCQDPAAVSFWRLGNAFDTMIDYLDVVGHTGAPEIEKMVRNQFNAYVWTRTEEGSFADYGPLVDDGVWNAYWTGTSCTFPGPKDGDPEKKD